LGYNELGSPNYRDHLSGHSVPLQAREAIQYVITDAAATTDGTWAYDADAYETLLHKAALVVLSPLMVEST